MKNAGIIIIINRFILYSLLFWPFIWGNASRDPTMMGSFQFIYISKNIMYVLEVVILVIFFTFSLIRIKKNNLEVLWYLGTIVIIALFSGLLNGSNLEPVFRTTYLHIRPLLVFFIIANLGMPRKYIRKAFLCLVALVIINVLVAYWQMVSLNLHGDYLYGIMRDGHLFAGFLWNAVFFSLAYILMNRKYALQVLIFLVFMLVLIFVAGFYQGLFLALPVISIGVFIYYSTKIGTIRYLFKISLTMIVFSVLTFKVIKMYEVGEPIRVMVEKLLPLIGEMGFVQGPLDLINAFAQKPLAIIVGFGPGRFGSQYALTEGNTGRSPLADSIYRSYWLTSDKDDWVTRTFLLRRSIMGRSSVFLAILSEYGIFAIVTIFLFFRKIFNIFFSVFRDYSSKFLSFLSLGSLMVVIYTLLFTITSLRDAYQAPSGIFPIMILSGLIYSSLCGKVGKFDYQSN